jgi:hypothetical protein
MDVSVDNQRLPNKRIDMDEVNAKGNGANLLDYRFFMYAVYLELCKIQKQENCSMALVNVGFSQILLFTWLRGWAIGFIVAFPLSYVLPPRLQKIVKK